jgi:excisionase family DNA binding protein
MTTVKISSRFKRETPYDKLNMNEIGEVLGLPKPEVMRLMFKGKLRFVKIGSQRRARRADVMACKAKIEAEKA